MGLRIAIVSDLHCMPKDLPRSNTTYLHTTTPGRPIVRHPVEAMKKLIREENISVDFLLCPGDITDQVNVEGYASGWRFVEEIASALKASNIYATIGNHDVDSRKTNPALAFKIAKELKVNYPLPLDHQQAQFWGDNFCVIEEPEYRLFILNSVHDHYDVENSKKISLTAVMLESIEEKLSKTDSRKVGIAMSHHHPISHYSSSYYDTDIIDKGDELLRILQKFNFNTYIHGHKHEPILRSYNEMNILASGSFASLENLIETESSNMFHVIEFSGMNKGIVKSWGYGLKNGWQNRNNGGFPSLTGFGFKGDLDNLAMAIKDWLFSKNTPISKLGNLIADIDDIIYLKPQEQIDLQKILQEKFSIEIIPNISFGSGATINLQIL